MTGSPIISMVLPVYNGADYLASALESVLAQTFGDFELICIDDCSTDGTAFILEDYAARDRRIVHLRNDTNKGLPATLNIGFESARGRFHSWTSHDNMLRPEMLLTLLSVFDRQNDIGIAYGGYSVIDKRGAVLRYVAPKPAEERWFGNPVGAAFLYRAEVTEQLDGYDESLFGAEDYDFWLRAARRFSLYPVDQDLYLYRRHDDSLTNQRSMQIKDLVAEVVVRELADVADNQLKAKALLNLVLNDNGRFRAKLVGQAFAASPSYVLHKIPVLAYHFARRVIAPLRG